MKIKQVFCSEQLAQFFHERFKRKYQLQDWTDLNEPVIFCGCYTPSEVNLALRFKNLVVIAWMGGDAMKFEQVKQLNKPNIKHIAQSSWIADDLRACGIEPIEIPVCCVEIEDWKPESLGDKIYLYTSHRMSYKYGVEHYTRLINDLGAENFIICEHNTHSKDDLRKIYKKSKFGLRLTKHDGLSETACELGLMGRIVLHNNANLPNSESFNEDYQDIKEKVQFLLNAEIPEKYTMGISKAVHEYLNINNEWLNTDYYD